MVSIGTITYLGSHGAELLRAGWTEAVLDPTLAEWARWIHEFGREHDTSEVRRRRVRLEDKGAIVAFHWRGAPDEDAARAAIDAIAAAAQDAGLRAHWGRKVLEVAPQCSSTRARRSRVSARLRRRRGAVRRRRRDRSGRVPFARRAGRGGRPRGRFASAWPPTRGRRRSFARLTSWSTEPTGLLTFSSCRRSVSAVLRIPEDDRAAQRGGCERARRGHPGGRARSGRRLVVPVAAGWWLVAAAIGIWMGRRAETSPPIAALLASARMQASLPEVEPEPHDLESAVGAARFDDRRGRARVRVPPGARGGDRLRGDLGARVAPTGVRGDGDRGARRRPVLRGRTSPLKPIQLVRTPGFRTNLMELTARRGTAARLGPAPDPRWGHGHTGRLCRGHRGMANGCRRADRRDRARRGER